MAVRGAAFAQSLLILRLTGLIFSAYHLYWKVTGPCWTDQEKGAVTVCTQSPLALTPLSFLCFPGASRELPTGPEGAEGGSSNMRVGISFPGTTLTVETRKGKPTEGFCQGGGLSRVQLLDSHELFVSSHMFWPNSQILTLLQTWSWLSRAGWLGGLYCPPAAHRLGPCLCLWLHQPAAWVGKPSRALLAL